MTVNCCSTHQHPDLAEVEYTNLKQFENRAPGIVDLEQRNPKEKCPLALKEQEAVNSLVGERENFQAFAGPRRNCLGKIENCHVATVDKVGRHATVH